MSRTDRELLAISNARSLLLEAGVWDLDNDLSCLVDRYIERSNKDRALEEFMLAVHERCSRVPLGHIVGVVDFDELPLMVGSGVFIPRRHSTVIHKWLESSSDVPQGAVVLDLCSGSGAIGLAIARRRPDLAVTCVEFDDIAVQYLKRNINRLAYKGIKAGHLQADINNTRAFSPYENKVGLIVANPPYVPQFLELLPEWSSHHPQASVYSGADGLELTRQIIVLASGLLCSEGWLVVEHGEDQAPVVRELFERGNLTRVQTVFDTDASDASGNSVMTVGCKSR